MFALLTIRSGVPILQVSASAHRLDGGMSAGFPRAAPLSAHLATSATSAALSDGSSLYFWMPMFCSMYHGGMTPAWGPIPVRCLIARAQGRTSSYVVSGICPPPPTLWQFSQLRCMIGAMSFVYVTCEPAPAGCCAVTPDGASRPTATTVASPSPTVHLQFSVITLSSVHQTRAPSWCSVEHQECGAEGQASCPGDAREIPEKFRRVAMCRG